MRISIHDILAKLHKACNRLIICGVLVLCGITGFLLIEKETPPLEKSHSFAMLKEDFLRAVRAYDIKSAKRLYGHLKEKNPYAPFVEEAAPAYLADIYIYYAKQMAFNPEAAGVFLTEARRLAPNHPLLVTIAPEAPVAPTPDPAWVEKTQALSTQINETEKIVAAETQAYVEELSMLEKTIESIEAYRVSQEAERLKAMLDKIETVALPEPVTQAPLEPVTMLMIEPPAPGVMPLAPEEAVEVVDAEKLALLDPYAEVVAEPTLTHPTDDACLLSYYTRNSPVSTCMDVVSDNQYGPSLFVIGDEGESPLAFTQQPITREAFNALCAETKSCTPEATIAEKSSSHPELSIDLSDVESTVQHYNSFCEMTQSCTGLVSANTPTLLEEDKLSEYVKVLSAKTGYPYRLMNENDVKQITAYFQSCVESEQCDPALGSDLAQFLKSQQGILLVRGMAG
ncbi:MAG: hypothetical protein ACHQAX_05610 [Gammaproteobacteria bacterium]